MTSRSSVPPMKRFGTISEKSGGCGYMFPFL
jgi:hypothetical protein